MPRRPTSNLHPRHEEVVEKGPLPLGSPEPGGGARRCGQRVRQSQTSLHAPADRFGAGRPGLRHWRTPGDSRLTQPKTPHRCSLQPRRFPRFPSTRKAPEMKSRTLVQRNNESRRLGVTRQTGPQPLVAQTLVTASQGTGRNHDGRSLRPRTPAATGLQLASPDSSSVSPLTGGRGPDGP